MPHTHRNIFPHMQPETLLESSTQAFARNELCHHLDSTNKEHQDGLVLPVSDAPEANIDNLVLQVSGTIPPQDEVETLDNVMSPHFFFS